MKKLLVGLVALLIGGSQAEAADNAVIITPGTGVTLRSKDVGAGLQAMVHILGDATGAVVGTMANYGTSPGAVLVSGVNAFVTNAVAITAAALPLPAGAATDASLGAAGSTVCATDTGSCSANALLQRIAQRITSLIAGGAVTIADGASVTLGAKADAAWVSGAGSVVAILKNAASSLTTLVNDFSAAGTSGVGVLTVQFPTTNFVFGTTAAMTATTSTQVIAAVASNRIYVTSISCVNSHATVGTFVTVQDGTGGTALATLAAAAVFGGDEKNNGGYPLFKTTVGNGVFVADVTTGANVICNASGFSGP